jgi:hypothetical protein
LEAPAGIIGFKPNWQPQDHRSFFTAAQGWGLFIQTRRDNIQTDRIEVRHGQLRIRELVFEVPDYAKKITATIFVGQNKIRANLNRVDEEIHLVLEKEQVLLEGQAVDITIKINR